MGVKLTAACTAVGLISATAYAALTQQVRGTAALTEEQLSVYRGFLERLGPTLRIKNLANGTIPFDFNGFPKGRPCLKGIELEDSSEPLRSVHAFGPEIAQGGALRLVDTHKQLDLFRKQEERETTPKQKDQDTANANDPLKFVIFSEIAFDTAHQFAVLKYILVCGSHCDSGGTLVMEKAQGRWVPRRGLACAMFVNNSQAEMPD